MNRTPHHEDDWLMAWANAAWFTFGEKEDYFRELDVSPPKTITELAARDQSMRFTGAGVKIGSVAWVSPEQRARLPLPTFSEDDAWIGMEVELEGDDP